jgi:hypothetical protein
MLNRFNRRWRIMLIAGCGAAIVAAPAMAREFSDWSAPVSVEALEGSSDQLNTAANDGCPILSPYDETLYIATNREAGSGPNDIWRAPRSGAGWGAPVKLPEPINSAANDFCPSPARGNRLFFVSTRGNADPANGDIYVAKEGPKGFTITKLGPNINSSLPEWSPSWFEDEAGNEILYFSRQNGADQDIYYSVNYGPAQLAQGGVNSSAADARPNVRHDGLEIVWDSNRTGSLGTDVWTARRSSTSDPWGTAEQVTAVNSAANESRASLSWDGTKLVFGSTRPGEGPADMYVSFRQKVTGN